MATRFYFVASTATSITPAFGSGWTSNTGAIRRNMATAQAATTEQVQSDIGATGPAYTMATQLISPPLTAQTISGTITVTSRGRELASTDNVNKRALTVRVFSGDGLTLRGTPFAFAATASTTELSATTLQGQVHATNASLTSVTCQAGDVLVVELGYGVGTSGTTPQSIMELGGTGTDHANTNADVTGSVPWVEFSANLSFQPTVIDLTVADAAQAQTADSPSLVVDLAPAAASQAQASTSPTLVLAGDPGVVPWVRDARYGGTGGTNTSVNQSVPIPTCQVGDDLWASFTLNSGHGAVTDPSGWTRIFPTTITDDGFMTLLIYRKTATATEVSGGTILTVVATAVRGNSGSMAIVGSDTAAAPDGVVTTTTTSGATSVSHTVTASTDNSLILSILGLDSATEDPTPTAPLVQWWDPMESGIIGQGNAGAVVHRPTAGSASYAWTWTNNVVRKAWTASIRTIPGTTLAVSAASQAQTSTTVALVVDLAPAAAGQAQTADTVALVVDLAPAAASQAQTADTVALGVDLTVAAAAQAQTADTVALVVDLAPAAASQAQTADTVTLTLPPFTVNDAAQAQTSTTPTLVLAGDPGVVPWVRDARYGGTGGTNTALNHTVPIPTCQVGDDLWASFTLNGGHGAVTGPAGWTRIFPTTITDDGFMTLLVYRKTATATEVSGGTILVTVGTAVRSNSGSMAIVGADTAAAPDGVVTSTTTSAATSLSLTVNASTDSSLILFILGLDSATENPTPTAPLVQWWDPMESGIIGQGNAGAVTHRPTAGSASYGWTWTSSVVRKGWAASIRSLAPGSTLTVAAASQAQTADTVSLVPDLAVAAASQAQTADTVPLVSGGIDIVIGSARQTQTADTVLLNGLAPAAASQAQTSTTVALVVDLAPAAASQAQTADTVTVASGLTLTVSNPTQTQTSTDVTLTQLHQLAADAATQALTSSIVIPTQIHVLAVDGATQAQTADLAPVTITYFLAASGAVQAQTSSAPTLTQVSPGRALMAPTPRAAPTMAARGSTAPTMNPAGRTGPTSAATKSATPTMTPAGRTGPTMTGG